MHTLTTSDTSWSLGVLLGGPIAVLFILAGLVALAFGLWMARDHEAGAGGLIFGAVAYLVLLGLFLASPLCYYPFDAEYHQWQPTEGTVSAVDKRLIGTGDGMEEKFVVRFEGDGQQYGCNDTRCASVKEGDHLSLTCKRAWQYAGTDGYDCRFIDTRAAS